MDFKTFLESGRTLLKDTKLPRKSFVGKGKKEKVSKAEMMTGKPMGSDDPYDVFVRKATHEKPKAKEMLEHIGRFIEVEEAKL